jgi:hypothetical protein
MSSYPSLENAQLPAPEVPLLTQEEGMIALRNLMCRGRSSTKGVIYRLNRQMRERYGMPLTGMTRSVYAHREVVYKLPRPGGGSGFLIGDCIEANLIESSLNTAGHDGLPLASRRLVWHKSGIPIIVMEKVETGLPADSLPKWSKAVDAQQVGRRTATGEYVVYDAGCMQPPSNNWLEDLLFARD